MFHDARAVVARPHGLGEFLFLHFLAPARMTLRGQVLHLAPGTCFFYAPDEPQLYSGDGVGLGNNAFHCQGPQVARIMARHHIPLNTPLTPASDSRLSAMLALIHEEYQTPSPEPGEAGRLLVELLCLELARQTRGGPHAGTVPSPRLRELRVKVAAAKSGMLRHLEIRWSVAALARSAGIGRSRFCAIYRDLFQASPIDDLLAFRLRKASYLLSGGLCTVSEAAAACGFTSVQYFCRLFRRRLGRTPGSVRARRCARG